MGHVKLEVSPIIRGTQVFAYQTILDHGQTIENKFIKANEEEIERRCAEIREELERKYEKQLTLERDKVKRKSYELYSIRLREVFYKLKAEFEEALKQREQQLIMEGERMRREAVEVVRRSMEEELLLATKMLEKSYNIKLKFLNEATSNEIREAYLEKINLYNNKWTDLVNNAKATARNRQAEIIDRLQYLHKLNLLEVIALERNLANRMIEETAMFFIGRIDSMRKEIHKLYYKLYEAQHQMKCNKIELESWECLLKDVVDQFQKFVNYVLEAIPGDAEYLLSLEKLLERRQKNYFERMKNVGLSVDEVLPMAEWERLSAKDSVTSETMSAIIHTIIDFISYKGTVTVIAKDSDAVLTTQDKESKELTPVKEESSQFTWCVESELTTTISDAKGTLSGLSSDKTYHSWDRVHQEDKYSEMRNEEGFYGEDGRPWKMRQYGEDYGDMMQFEEQFLGGRIHMFERFGESPLKTIKTPSPTIITQYLDTSNITSTSLVSSSSYISPVIPDRCDDEWIIKTKSEVEAEAEKLAKDAMDLRFMGVERPPGPKDKGKFVKGRILSILNIMKAHPQFHNVLIEP
ncbi:hypothetical protein O3M35_013177 [Rhynocoris fuscipes]